MQTLENLLVLARGNWRTEDILFHRVVQDLSVQSGGRTIATIPVSDVIQIPQIMNGPIEENWERVLEANPLASPGKTFRVTDWYEIQGKLVIEVIPANYRLSTGGLGWLAGAFGIITSDDYIALQKPVRAISASIGGGIRIPGYNVRALDILEQTAEQVRKEFGIRILKQELTIVGLVLILPAVSKRHFGIVIKVKVSYSSEELKKAWEKAEDKWEGEIALLELDRQRKRLGFDEFGGFEAFNRQSLLILSMIAESELGVELVKPWPRLV